MLCSQGRTTHMTVHVINEQHLTLQLYAKPTAINTKRSLTSVDFVNLQTLSPACQVMWKQNKYLKPRSRQLENQVSRLDTWLDSTEGNEENPFYSQEKVPGLLLATCPVFRQVSKNKLFLQFAFDFLKRRILNCITKVWKRVSASSRSLNSIQLLPN